MNYIPLGGYWFYGGSSDVERATFFCSYGLLSDAPDTSGLYHRAIGILGRGLKYILGGQRHGAV